MTSIRLRVSAWTIVGTVVILGITSFLWYRTTAGELSAQFDRTLLARAAAIASLVEPTDEGEQLLEIELLADLASAYEPGPDAAYFALWCGDGGPIAASASLADAELPRPDVQTGSSLLRDVRLPDGRAGRACQTAWLVQPRLDDEDAELQAARIGDGVVAELVLAEERSDLDAALLSLRTSTIGVSLAMALGAAALVSWLVSRGLAPLRELGREVASLDPNALPDSIAMPDVPAELRPVVDRLNELLTRIRDAIDRERRTTAAIAHELRTPIAELRSLTDVALKWPDDAEFGRTALTEANGIAVQMGTLADTVLGLARADGGDLEPRFETFDLADVTHELVSAHQRRAMERSLDLRVSVNGPSTVHSDRGMIGIIGANLLANAVEHSPAGSAVRCSLEGSDAHVELTVRNAANGLGEADVARLTERFWRKDDARTQRDHAGLGLALTRDLCERLGIELRFALTAGDLVVSARLPRGG